MAKRLQEYVKYSIKELESYTKQEGSCVRKINSNLHISLGPYCLADFKHALSAHIMRRKVGYYDDSLEGIVLDIKNIKVLSKLAALRADDPRIHVDVNADCYVFCPIAGAILSGVVKHIGNHHIGVIIYRVFNVSIRFAAKLNKEEFKMDDTVQFRIKNFNLQNVFPYIEGDLVTASGDKITHKFIKVEPESADSNIDSGIETRDNQELDELVNLIKQEKESEEECTPKKATKNKDKANSSKRKRKASESVVPIPTPTPIKKEPSSEKRKRKQADSVEQENTKTDKATVKSKTKKTNGELLNATQIKKEELDDSFTTPTKKRRKSKMISISLDSS
ncbi:PREDICTED: DNA-directed RNA polymerase I subunit RPA43 [Bactrocera latifrons]|uniref:DNA-directed RNA polymerase I subunit RPA43 n=1 Tax=Bactrocera latifrons TaxID=174628 RepID=A0A0K8VDQ8_BACLA|nr:PREDICTED: DNA-directed RNA polymerase I subunit RPA43 [Bactrocera latifrons]